jgi:thioredoxin 1
VSDNVRVLTDQNWEQEVLRSDVPVLVDFWAAWCAPCRMIAPSIEALAGEYAGKAMVGKLNVDDNPMVAARYDVRSIPTLIVFKGGQVAEQRVGALPRAEIARLVDAQLGTAQAGASRG